MTLAKAFREYQARDLKGALATAERALGKVRTDDRGLLALMGKIRLELGHKREAADAFARAGEGAPNEAQMMKLAVTLHLGEGSGDGVRRLGPRAVALNLADIDLAFAVATRLLHDGAYEEMLPVLDRLDPARDTHLALIINHHRLSGRHLELVALLQRATKAFPENGFVRSSTYLVARETCDVALMSEHAALMRDPGSAIAQDLLSREAAMARLTWSDDEALNAAPNLDSITASASLPPPGTPRRAISPAGEKLRIGYLSNDFFHHATMTLFRDVMIAHDRDRFDVSLFCHSPEGSLGDQQAWPAVLRDAVTRIDRLSDAEAAAAIDAAGIDILVDLKGHTLGARLGVVNRARAPIKATYLGFPGSVGGVELDYAITDRIVTPDASKPHFAEKLCRLPESYQANSCRSRPFPGPASRAQHGLPEDAFVIASFNVSHKIGLATLDLWARVLNAVPDALFWCMCPPQATADKLVAVLAERGVARERIVIAGRSHYPDHVSRLPLADLAIDTLPYNGHTTTSDMLWAGLPVLGLKGGSFASRVTESLLTAVGLPELVTETPDDYAALAASLAADRPRLAAIRSRLAEARFIAPLFDAERFARHIEAAYDLMAARARAGQAPDHIDVAALPPRETPFWPVN